MLDQNCAYCMKGDLVAKFGYFCCEMESSNVYIFKEQSHPGRLIVAHKKHVSEIIELTDEERNQFFKDINTVSNAIHKVYNPDKVNYGAYGDTGHHLHFHLVPKYKDDFEWNGVFLMNPGLKIASDAECEEIAKKLRAAMNK